MTDSGDGIGDDCAFTTHRQRIACRLDDGIAIVAGVVGRISAFHDEVLQVQTVVEHVVTYGSDRTGNRRTRQPFAASKGGVTDGGDSVTDGHVGQPVTIAERIAANSED